MEVTKSNFLAVLPEVEEAIESADFVSFDTEFTGLTNKSEKVFMYEETSERYRKILKNTESYMQVQFGLCTFKWNKEDKKYTSKAYNFYIFPMTTSSLRSTPDRTFSCQSSSLEFLVNQGFDFNKVFRKGISYVREDEKMSLRQEVDKKQLGMDNFEPGKKQRRSSLGSSAIPLNGNPKLKKFVEDTIIEVRKFIQENKEDELVLDGCNSYLRKALYEHIPKTFDGNVFLDFKNVKGVRRLCVCKGSEEEYRKTKFANLKHKNEKDFQQAVGFSRIFKVLIEKAKLIVGHNMLLDLLYSIRQYVCELPDNLEDFKALYKCLFTNVVDTKLIASMPPFRDLLESTALGDLYLALKTSQFAQVELDPPIEYVGDDEDLSSNLHAAAYDAYVTGYSLILMAQHLNSYLDIEKRSPVFTNTNAVFQPYLNKINITKIHEVAYINMTGTDIVHDYDDVYHVSIPSEWKVQEVRDHFIPYQVNICWIDQTSCFVRTMDKKTVNFR